MVVVGSTTDWIAAVAALVQALAIVVGGIWAYYEFVRSRKYASRAEVRVNGTLLTADGAQGISVAATLHNPGATDIPLRAPIVTAQTVSQASWGPAFAWREVGFAPIFTEHARLEAGETVSDEALISLPELDGAAEDDFLAYRVECVVFEGGTDGKGGVRWSGATIVPGRLRAPEIVAQGQEEVDSL